MNIKLKKLMSVLLCCVMLFGMVPVNAFATGENTDSGFTANESGFEEPIVPESNEPSAEDPLDEALMLQPRLPEPPAGEGSEEDILSDEPGSGDENTGDGQTSEENLIGAAGELFNRLMAAATYEELDAMMEAMTEEEYELLNWFSNEQKAALTARVAFLNEYDNAALADIVITQGETATHTVDDPGYFNYTCRVYRNDANVTDSAGITVTADDGTITIAVSETTAPGEYEISYGWAYNRYNEVGRFPITVAATETGDSGVTTGPAVETKKMSYDKTATARGDGTYDLELTLSGSVGSKTNKAKLDVIFIVDNSNSMYPNYSRYMENLKPAMKSLVTNMSQTNGEKIDAKYAIVRFGTQAQIYQNFANAADTISAIDNIARYSSNNDGGTNYQYGIYQGKQLLNASGRRKDAMTVVIFVTDGLPTYRGTKTINGNGQNDSESKNIDAAVDEIEEMSCNYFYCIGIGDEFTNKGSTQYKNMGKLTDAVNAKNTGIYAVSGGQVSDLNVVFNGISSSVTTFLCSDVTITDTLNHNDNGELMVDVTDPGTVKVTVSKGDKVIAGPAASVTLPETDNNAEAILTASYNSDTHKLMLDFPSAYKLEPDYTYKLSCVIKPTEKAYEKLRDTGYTDIGDEGTGTYSNAAGFYSNDEAKVTYKYEGNPGTAIYNKPVVQLNPGTLVINKTINGVDADKLSNLAFNIELTYPDGHKTTETIPFAQFEDTDGVSIYTLEGLSPETHYSVTEIGSELDGYLVETTATGASGTIGRGETKTASFTNKYTVATVDIPVTKVWNDANNQAGFRPASITINLLANDTKVTSKVVTAAEGWAWTFEGVQKYDKNGKEIKYTITEDAVEHYGTAVTGNAAAGFVVTNTHVPSVITISGSKTWVDAENQDGLRPASITINLEKNHEVIDTKTVTAANGWAWTFDNLPEYAAGQKIVYTISEAAVEGYTTSYNGFNVTNTHVPAVTSINVTKNWVDAENQDGKRPNSITVVLLANGKETDKTLVLSEGNKWTGSFADLDKFAAGEKIVYTVQELKVEGYETVITGNQYIGYTITNTHTPETITVSGSKTWEDNNNQDGARPASITINLLKNGEVIGTKTVTTADGWAWSFENLPKYENGTLIKYSIIEDTVEDYSTEYNGYNVINTHTPAQTSVTVSKSWDDNNDQDGKRPNDITVKLLANGTDTGKTLVLNEGNNWTGSFTALDKFANGQIIHYTVKEIAVEGYTTAITGDQSIGYTITNTHAPETVEVSGAKTWKDNFNQDGKRPDSITIKLLANGEVITTIEVTARNNWSWTFTGLPKYENHGTLINYTITETAVEDYTTEINGFNVTNTHAPEKTSVSVVKSWQDNNDQDGIRPNDITVVLVADDIATDKTLVLNQGNNWTSSFTELDKFANGKEIVYTVAEIKVPGYESVITGDQNTGYTITNSHTPAVVAVSGSKTWDDNNNQDGFRPESITINLLRNGEVIDTETVTAADGWAWSFTNLPKYENHGTLINYTITETAVEDYTTEINGFNVTNTHAPEKTSVTVTKAWQDNNDQDGIRPESITVKLLGNGVDTGKTLVLNQGNSWTGSFADLDKYADGEVIKYTVAEVAVTGYNSVITGNQADGYTITNSHTPAVVAVSGSKTWNDNNNQDGKRPASITINLLKNGAVLDTKNVTAENGWAWSFTNLPKYENHGTLITYSIEEIVVDQYITEYDGYDVINTHAPEKTSVTVTKAWEDNNDQDGIRPNDITVVLVANGTETENKLVLNDTNNWTGSFTDLDKYANGAVITYTVQEIKVDGYNSVISGTQAEGYTITNSHTPAVVTVAGAKTWDDKDNQDGKRPESITINLLADGVQIDSKTVTKDDDWAWSFTNLPEFKNHGTKIIYTINEVVSEDYTVVIDGFNVTNKYTPEETSVTVTKSWQDKDDQDGIRPEKITVNLLADGKKVDTQKISAEDNWTYTFTKLDVYAKGVKIVYTVEEETVEGYETVITGDQKEGFIITNSHTPEVVAVAGGKTWDDGNNQDGKRPDAITVNLLANGKVIETIQVTEAEGWAWNFTNLPKFEAGEEILYTVTEDAVEDYTTTYDGYNIINKYTPKKTSITVTKRWVDGQNHDGIRPNSVKVVLYANGKKVDTMRLTEKGKWSGVFKDLPVYQNGEPIKYTLQEKSVSGYNATITGNARKGFIVTNTHNIIPKTGDESNLPLYTGLFGAGFSAMAVLMFLAKPRKKGKYAR